MTSSAQTLRQSLAARLNGPGLISVPGVFDMISARIADAMGFDALYMTGYGTVASHLGLPDAGLASYTEMVGRVRQIAEGTDDAADRRWRHRLWRPFECRFHRARL